jgi:hypothetical protein
MTQDPVQVRADSGILGGIPTEDFVDSVHEPLSRRKSTGGYPSKGGIPNF